MVILFVCFRFSSRLLHSLCARFGCCVIIFTLCEWNGFVAASLSHTYYTFSAYSTPKTECHSILHACYTIFVSPNYCCYYCHRNIFAVCVFAVPSSVLCRGVWHHKFGILLRMLHLLFVCAILFSTKTKRRERKKSRIFIRKMSRPSPEQIIKKKTKHIILGISTSDFSSQIER